MVFLQCPLQEFEESSLEFDTECFWCTKLNFNSNLIIPSIAALGINFVVVQACSIILVLHPLGSAGVRITVGGSYSVSPQIYLQMFSCQEHCLSSLPVIS